MNIKINGYINLLQQGKEEGYDYFFHRYYQSLCFFAHSFIDNRAEAEDIVQEAFVRLWEKKTSFSNELQLKSYLYKTVQYRCLDVLRSGATQKELLTEDNAEEPVLNRMIHAELWRELLQQIESLPPAIGKVIRMIYLEGLTVKETAKELHKSASAVKGQRKRGIELLRVKHKRNYMLLLLLQNLALLYLL